MPDFDIQVRFQGVNGIDEDAALDRLIHSLHDMYPVSSPDTECDWVIVDAKEVAEDEDA